MRRTLGQGVVWLLVVALPLSGCSALDPREVHVVGANAPAPALSGYQFAALNCRLHARRAGDAETHVQIQYPHPDGRTGYALVEIVATSPTHAATAPTEAKSWWRTWLDASGELARDHLPGVRLSDEVREAWTLDIPKAQLDPIVARLETSGYFDGPARQEAGAAPLPAGPHETLIALRLDERAASKPWPRFGELDQLVARARREGRLASCTHLPLRPSEAPALADDTRAVGAPVAPTGPVTPVSWPAPETEAPAAGRLERLPPVGP